MRTGVEFLSIAEIAALLANDGYPARMAAAVKLAAWYGCLRWTAERLTSTREIEFDLTPARVSASS
jgi:hypothetical protein